MKKGEFCIENSRFGIAYHISDISQDENSDLKDRKVNFFLCWSDENKSRIQEKASLQIPGNEEILLVTQPTMRKEHNNKSSRGFGNFINSTQDMYKNNREIYMMTLSVFYGNTITPPLPPTYRSSLNSHQSTITVK